MSEEESPGLNVEEAAFENSINLRGVMDQFWFYPLVFGVTSTVVVILVCFCYNCKKKQQLDVESSAIHPPAAEPATVPTATEPDAVTATEPDAVTATETQPKKKKRTDKKGEDSADAATAVLSRYEDNASDLEIDRPTLKVFQRKNYEILKMLNKGAFGQVFKARQTSDGKLCAVKVMFLDKLQKVFKEKFLEREITALSHVRHQYIVEIFDIIRSGGRMYIFMEFMAKGGIDGHLKKMNKGLTEQEAGKWFAQVLEALQYLHQEMSMAHRDIKVDNILLDEDMNAKLSDFGFAKEIRGHKLCTTHCGTPPYESPQIIRKRPYDGFAADMWAMGVTLFAMLNNKYLFHCNPRKDKPEEIDTEKMLEEMMNYPGYLHSRCVSEFSRECMKLLEGLLNPDEDGRWTVKKAVKCQWVKRKGRV